MNKEFTYKECENMNKVFADMNKKIQRYRRIITTLERCIFCINSIHNGKNMMSNAYCRIGGFKLKGGCVCDLYKEKGTIVYEK